MNGNFRAALAISLALVISSWIASWAFLKAKRLDQTIQVTGSSRKRIKSDLMIWGASVTVEAPRLADAYAKLTHDVSEVRAFLVSQGFPESQIVTESVTTTQLRRQSQKYQGEAEGPVSGYQLQQSLRIRSTEIDKLTAVSRNVTQLINGAYSWSRSTRNIFIRIYQRPRWRCWLKRLAMPANELNRSPATESVKCDQPPWAFCRSTLPILTMSLVLALMTQHLWTKTSPPWFT